MPRRTASVRLVMSKDERQLLAEVAEHLRRSRSDTLRWAVVELAERLGIIPGPVVAQSVADSTSKRLAIN
jgi:hypothetical protein